MRKFLVLSVVVAGAFLASCASEGEKDTATPTPSPSNSGLSSGNDLSNGNQLEAASLSQHVVYFDFDSSELKADSQPVIANWAKYLSANPTAKVRLEGSTDERGTREYNIALGERRSRSVQQALQLKGVSAGQLSVISYGEERPVALGHDESSWSQNRRVELVKQ